MKAIVVTHDQGLFPIVDSAIGRDAMPLFIPDSGEWTAQVAVAARIGRLGKCIAPKFALRYADGVGLVALLRPRGTELPRWLAIMDSALTTGRWLPVPDTLTLDSRVDYAGELMAIAATDYAASLTSAIVDATQMSTIKTGDIIIPRQEAVALDLRANTRIEGWINGQQCLNLKVK